MRDVVRTDDHRHDERDVAQDLQRHVGAHVIRLVDQGGRSRASRAPDQDYEGDATEAVERDHRDCEVEGRVERVVVETHEPRRDVGRHEPREVEAVEEGCELVHEVERRHSESEHEGREHRVRREPECAARTAGPAPPDAEDELAEDEGDDRVCDVAHEQV